MGNPPDSGFSYSIVNRKVLHMILQEAELVDDNFQITSIREMDCSNDQKQIYIYEVNSLVWPRTKEQERMAAEEVQKSKMEQCFHCRSELSRINMLESGTIQQITTTT